MYYKRDNCLAIRMKGGSKRQVLSFGGSIHRDKTQAELRAVGKQAVKKLKEGASYAETKALCFEQIA